MATIRSIPNPDLTITDDNKSRWTAPDHRRRGWHHLHRLARYTMSFRAAQVMTLQKQMDLRIAESAAVRHFTSLPWFCAMVVIQGQHVLFERYASDFGPDAPHSIQSITKTTVNLMIGQLLEQGLVDLAAPVARYIPEIGSGYAEASLRQVLNMDVVNDYSEDFADPNATYYRHEEAMGWRLPLEPHCEQTQHSFLARIGSADTVNRTGHAIYKDANTDVLGWVVERASGRSLRSFLADIVDAAGIEGTFHITTDRLGVPGLDGGACVTARDLARYFSIFARRGRGISGEAVGSSAFIEDTLTGGVPRAQPLEWIRYSNHTMTTGRTLGHSGWGGQYAVANPHTGVVAVFFSVIENDHAAAHDYLAPIIRMLEAVTELDF